MFKIVAISRQGLVYLLNNNNNIIIIIYTEFKHHTFWMVAAREAMPGRQTSQRDKVE